MITMNSPNTDSVSVGDTDRHLRQYAFAFLTASVASELDASHQKRTHIQADPSDVE